MRKRTPAEVAWCEASQARQAAAPANESTGSVRLFLARARSLIAKPSAIVRFDDDRVDKDRHRAAVTFNDAFWIARRHGLSDATQAAVRAIHEGMAAPREAL